MAALSVLAAGLVCGRVRVPRMESGFYRLQGLLPPIGAFNRSCDMKEGYEGYIESAVPEQGAIDAVSGVGL